MSKKVLSFFGFVSIVILGFQNCQQGLQVQDLDVAADTVITASSAKAEDIENNDASGGPSEVLDSTLVEHTLKASLESTTSAKVDCSRNDAVLYYNVKSSNLPIKICLEYVLDLPSTNSRSGTRYLCDSDSKFSNPPESWAYNPGSESWAIPAEFLKDHPIIVPGTYYLVVKGEDGQRSRSNGIKVARPGKEDCAASDRNTVAAPSSGSCIVAGPGGTCSSSGSETSVVTASVIQTLPSTDDISSTGCITAGPGDCVTGPSTPEWGVQFYGNSWAAIDCSSPRATISLTVPHAEKDITVCMAYKLQLVGGHARDGETYNCDAENKFVPPPSNWEYLEHSRTIAGDLGKRWVTAVERLQNHKFLLPGVYTVYVKDSKGVIKKSEPVVIGRLNYSSCWLD